MKLNPLFLFIGLTLFWNTEVFTQTDLPEADHYLTSKDKVTNQIPGTSEIDGIILTTNFLRNIRTTTETKLTGLSFFYNDQSGEPTRQIENATKLYLENSKSVVLLVAEDGSSMGAGCVVSEDGYIVTNYHVVQNQNKMLTFFYDKDITSLKELDPENFKVADVVAAVPEKDLALLKLPLGDKYKPLRFGNNAKIEVAQDVFAIGHPETYIWSFTYGVISQLRNNYEWYYDEKSVCRANVIQTQTPINPGNSGGPLFNEDGELIGINTFRTGEAEGLNFAVRIDEIGNFVKESESGKHKYNFVSRSPSKKKEITWDLVDYDENGKDDGEAADINGDGKYDIVRVDENEDGHIDYIIMDLNEDGKVDAYIFDKNKDDFFEYYIYDSDGNGQLDTVGIDYNKDGTPDKFYDYK
jgi:S1-C subfamily serine protease